MKVGYLVMGLVFVTFAGCWLLVQTEVVSGDDQVWLLPVPWVLGSGVGLIALGIQAMTRHRGPAADPNSSVLKQQTNHSPDVGAR